MDFTSRQFRAFLLVAEHRSFSRAAEALYVTPSALSVLIRELESQLGFRLFDRTTRHVGLTSHGNELLGVVRRTLDQLDAAILRIGQSVIESAVSMSVGAPLLIAANVLPQITKEFRMHRPDLQIRILDVIGTSLTQMVQAGDLDMALGAFFDPVPGVRRVSLFRFSLVVIRPDNDPGLRRVSTTWSALKGDRLIALTPTNPVQQFIDKHLTRMGIILRPSSVCNHLDMQIAMVEAGEGVAIIPSYVLPACRNRAVFMSRLINPVVNVTLSQLRKSGRRLPPGADEFTSFLQRYLVRWAGRAGILQANG